MIGMSSSSTAVAPQSNDAPFDFSDLGGIFPTFDPTSSQPTTTTTKSSSRGMGDGVPPVGAGRASRRSHRRSNTIDVLPIIPQDMVPFRIQVQRPAPIAEDEEGFGWDNFPLLQRMKVPIRLPPLSPMEGMIPRQRPRSISF